jgi:hypothetical protein
MHSPVDRLVHGCVLVSHSDRLPSFETSFHHAAFLVLAALIAVLVAQVNLHSRDMVADVIQGILNEATDMRGQSLVSRDVVVGVYLYLHGMLLLSLAF